MRTKGGGREKREGKGAVERINSQTWKTADEEKYPRG